jgi:mannose-6-phosphate isomerase-like protein (cupin superfamily)
MAKEKTKKDKAKRAAKKKQNKKGKKSAGLSGAAKKEAFFKSAEAKIESFAFKRPEIDFATAKKKIHVRLTGTNTVRASIQVLSEGGENNLHYHPNMDLIYMVLKGRVRFYGPGDKVLGEYGAMEGILLPENTRYWFESVGVEEAHLMQIAGYPKGEKAFKRIELEAPKQADGGEGVWFDQKTGETLSDAEHKAKYTAE